MDERLVGQLLEGGIAAGAVGTAIWMRISFLKDARSQAREKAVEEALHHFYEAVADRECQLTAELMRQRPDLEKKEVYRQVEDAMGVALMRRKAAQFEALRKARRLTREELEYGPRAARGRDLDRRFFEYLWDAKRPLDIAPATEMSDPAADSFGTFEDIERISWFQGFLRGVRENQVAKNEERVKRGRIRRIKARVEVSEESEKLYKTNIPTQETASISSIGAYVMQTVRENLEEYSPPPIGHGQFPVVAPARDRRETLSLGPGSGMDVDPPVKAPMTDDQVQRIVMAAIASCGANQGKWEVWYDRLFQDYPRDAGRIAAAAGEAQRRAALQNNLLVSP
jgi:hypothetical protein